MEKHSRHEEASLHGCQAVRALCSSGDMSNQRLLRRAGACTLVAIVLKQSAALGANSPSFTSDNAANIGTSNTGIAENSGLFSQMLTRARGFSQSTLHLNTGMGIKSQSPQHLNAGNSTKSQSPLASRVQILRDS